MLAAAEVFGSQLADAVRAGDHAAVRGLLSTANDGVNATEADGTTALHWAVERDDMDAVRVLLAAGANPAAVSRTSVTPLSLAALNGNLAIVRALLDASADPNALLSGGQTALMTAARAGSIDVVLALLARGGDPNHRESVLGETAVMWAAAEDHGDVIRMLAEGGADVNARSTVLDFPVREFGDGKSGRLTVLPAGGWTPLMYAARQNRVGAVEALARAGADLNATDPDGTSALLVAVINAHYELAARLLDLGADPDIADSSGMGPLYAAVDMNTFTETPGRPPPLPFGIMDAPAMVRTLLDRGADPNARLTSPILVRVHDGGDFNLGEGATPLMRATRKGDVTLTRVLLERGADAGRAMANGGTALMFAAGLGGAGRFTAYEASQATEADRLQTVTLLLDAGADANAVDGTGQTALHMAAAEREEDVIRLLVARGGRLDLMDGQGRTSLDVAMGAGRRGRGSAVARPEIANVLRALRTDTDTDTDTGRPAPQP
jgi:ankyrin repeat protein